MYKNITEAIKHTGWSEAKVIRTLLRSDIESDRKLAIRHLKKRGYCEINKENLESGMVKGIGMSKAQAYTLGITYPLKRGWKERVIGNLIPEWRMLLFHSIKGMPKPRSRQTVYREFAKRKLPVNLMFDK